LTSKVPFSVILSHYDSATRSITTSPPPPAAEVPPSKLSSSAYLVELLPNTNRDRKGFHALQQYLNEKGKEQKVKRTHSLRKEGRYSYFFFLFLSNGIGNPGAIETILYLFTP
jgi:hypothetical protein